MARMKRVLAVILAICICVPLACWVYLRYWWSSGPRLKTESEITKEVRPDHLPLLLTLTPGTVVESPMPEGWSDLVIKTITAVEAGDVDTLPAFAKRTAARFRTVILADTRRDRDGGPYRLNRVGVGLCLNIHGKDTAISSPTLKSQKVELGTVDSLVLVRAEKALGRSYLAAVTPTFALYDSFVELSDAEGLHHSIVLRYAIVVDPGTGRIRTAYWTMAEQSSEREIPQSMTLLPPDCEFHCGIHIAARRVIGSVAASWGFAMVKLPPGESVSMPRALRIVSVQDDFGGESAESLEKLIRESLEPSVARAVKPEATSPGK